MTDQKKDEPPRVTLVVDSGAGSIALIAALNGHMLNDDRVIQPVQCDPNINGEHGKAWRIDEARFAERLGLPKDGHGGVASWIIEARWAHPIWHSYVLALVHLRPTPLLPKPSIRLPGATHEFFLFALDPDADRTAMVMGEEKFGRAMLTPAQFCAQLKCDSDEAAVRTLEYTVKDIVAGKLSPDTDYRVIWEERFGRSGYKEQYR